jgi:hypothetical protein
LGVRAGVVVTFEIEIIESVSERVARDGLSALTEPERFYRAIWLLEAEVANGGFEQFFFNCSAADVRDAIAGLRAIGAPQMAVLLSRAVDLCCEPATSTPHLHHLTTSQAESLNGLSNRFSDYPEDLSALVSAYVERHDSHFRGPRTPLELWHSKRARGESTVPRYAARQMDFEREAESDRAISSRSCPECGYPNPDYRRTCKRCGYPHGVAL